MKKRFKAELVDSIFVDENKVEHDLTTANGLYASDKFELK